MSTFLTLGQGNFTIPYLLFYNEFFTKSINIFYSFK